MFLSTTVPARFFVSLTVAALSFINTSHANPADAVIKQKIKDAEAARQQIIKDNENHIMLSFIREDAEDKHFVFYVTGFCRDAIHSLCRPSSYNARYYINVMTKNASALYEACPSLDGDTYPCIVDFEHKGDVVTKITSARKPKFDGVTINQAGSMVEDGKLCTSPGAPTNMIIISDAKNGETTYI